MENQTLTNELELPLVVQLKEMSPDAFISHYVNNKLKYEELLRTNGSVKFSGVRIDNLETFQYIVNSISEKFLAYIDGTSPRTKLTGHVYTSTEYDPSQRITMHNELSYSAKWPSKIFFTCLTPAQTGGETLLADSREMLKRMDKDIVEEIERKGVMYIRNLHSGNGIGSSWQKAFETEDRAQLEEYCRQLSIEFEWHGSDILRLRQPSRGIIEHRVTREKVWFNQIDQFHPCQLGEELYTSMTAIYDSPEDFPTYVKYGDGTDISEDVIKKVLKTSEEITIAPPWNRNELLIVDNELVSHGRNKFTGDRKVLVAMSE